MDDLSPIWPRFELIGLALEGELLLNPEFQPIRSGKISITSQNHGFALDADVRFTARKSTPLRST